MTLAFWIRTALSSLVVNIPLAFGMVWFGMSPVVAFAYSAVSGAVLYLVWSGHGARAAEEAPGEVAAVSRGPAEERTPSPKGEIRDGGRVPALRH